MNQQRARDGERKKATKEGSSAYKAWADARRERAKEIKKGAAGGFEGSEVLDYFVASSWLAVASGLGVVFRALAVGYHRVPTRPARCFVFLSFGC